MEENFYQMSSEKALLPKTKKQQEEFLRRKLEYENEAPIIAATISRLQKAVDDYTSVYAIKEETDPAKFMFEVAVNKRVATILAKEINRLEMEVKKYSGKN